MNYYQLRIYDQQGKFVQIVENFERLDVSKNLNSVGVLELTWPLHFAPSITVDYILILEVSVNNSPMRIWGETCYFVQELNYDGNQFIITAYDALSLLNRRIIAYPSQSAYTVKSGRADDLVKELMRENVGLSVLDSRRLLPNLTIDNDVSFAPIVSVEVPWSPLLEAIQDIAEMSINKGVPLYFDILCDYDLNLTFRTYINTRGIDRRSLVLNENHLNNVQLSIDWSNSRNVVYVGGSGQGEDRNIEAVIDNQSINQSLYGWREQFHTNRNVGESATLIDDGLSVLQNEVVRFSGDFINQPNMEYLKHFNFGDLVTVQGYGYRFTCAVDGVNLTVDNGVESVSIRFEAK